MPAGLVKFLNADKNYGFIVPADGGREVFFHGSTVEDEGFADLWEGQQVGYEVTPPRNASDERGPRASVVRPLRLTRAAAPTEPEGHAPLQRHNRSLAKKPSWRR